MTPDEALEALRELHHYAAQWQRDHRIGDRCDADDDHDEVSRHIHAQQARIEELEAAQVAELEAAQADTRELELLRAQLAERNALCFDHRGDFDINCRDCEEHRSAYKRMCELKGTP